MKYRKSYHKYISQLAQIQTRPFYCGTREKINNVVVIPCFAESRYILKTLYSLSQNDFNNLKNTIILCVVNNKCEAFTDNAIIKDNKLTMTYLNMLTRDDHDLCASFDLAHRDLLNKLIKTELRVAYIDASSSGHEMPYKGGGVGMARKIGLDAALCLFDNNEDDLRLLYCLDADTIVESNYLKTIRTFFEKENATAACVSFSHQEAADEMLQAAISGYELFLRYYVMGLKYAGSPYAFHTIGSTMICTADGYAAVRGMNKRQAGEDFYFLNKISKLDGIKSIKDTTVYPSARPSTRVPFGTGKAVREYGQVRDHNYLVYNPSIFVILKQWLCLTSQYYDLNAEKMLNEAGKIHTALRSFLQTIKFKEVWRKLQTNNASTAIFKEQFNTWFDGFITLKLINYLSRNGEPPVNIMHAVNQVVNKMGSGINIEEATSHYNNLEAQKRLLNLIKRMEIMY